MHIKRNEMPKTWPVARKGTKYLLVASHSKRAGIPILFTLREMLGLARTRKEVIYMVHNKEIKLNGKIIHDDKIPMQISDVLGIEKIGKNYRLEIKKGKFKLEEIGEKDAGKKIAKIIGKKILEKNKTQINLSDGRNFIIKENFSVGDSALINLKENKIEKILRLKDGAKVEIIGGKHVGQEGEIKKEKLLERERRFIVKIGKGEIDLPSKTLKVIE
jgi:small subunit ribosomal protein S4e